MIRYFFMLVIISVLCFADENQRTHSPTKRQFGMGMGFPMMGMMGGGMMGYPMMGGGMFGRRMMMGMGGGYPMMGGYGGGMGMMGGYPMMGMYG